MGFIQQSNLRLDFFHMANNVFIFSHVKYEHKIKLNLLNQILQTMFMYSIYI